MVFLKKTLPLILILISGIPPIFSQAEKMIEEVVKSQKAQNLKSSDVEFLSGRISISINEITYYNPIKKGRRRVAQKQTRITTGFYGRINKNRVKLYQSKPPERMKCESYTSCPVYNGSSKFALQRDPNTKKITESKEYPMLISTKYLNWLSR